MSRVAPRLVLLALVTLVAAPLASAQEQEPAPVEFERPSYSFLRQNESWSGLRGLDRTETGDFWDRIKFVPLNRAGDVWLSFGADLRARGEAWSDFNFGAPPSADPDDVFLLTRVLVHGDLHVGDSLRLFVQGKSALSHGRDLVGGDRLLDEDPAELQQAFVDWSPTIDGGHPLTIRPGRQMLLFGKQRLVSPLPWGNTLRSWDGVSASWQNAGWKTTGFYTEFDPVDQEQFNQADSGIRFYGIYAARPAGPGRLGVDLYWLGLGFDDAAYNGTTGDEERQSLGARFSGGFGDGFEYDVEGTYQFGEVGDASISAWSFASELGHSWKEAGGKPRAWLGFDYASGDSTSGGSVGTFNQLFPLGHAYLGYIDQIGRQNIIDLSLFGQLTLLDWRWELSGHSFWAADTSDALYNAGGAPFRAGGSYSSRDVGMEVDLITTRKFGRHLTAQLGYGHFFAGDAIEESGPSDDIDFGYLSLEYGF